MPAGEQSFNTLRPLGDSDRADIKAFIEAHWHAPYVCVRDQRYRPHEGEGFLLRRDSTITGLVTYEVQGDCLLMTTLNSTEPGLGIGSSLVLRVIEEARKRQLHRVWLTTTNDNLKAIGFYQRMGFRLVAIYPDAVTRAREALKPQVPEFGVDGLPIYDEIEMELILQPYTV